LSKLFSQGVKYLISVTVTLLFLISQIIITIPVEASTSITFNNYAIHGVNEGTGTTEWDTIHDETSGDSTSNVVKIYTYNSKWEDLSRVLVYVDTSGLPDDAVIESAYFRIASFDSVNGVDNDFTSPSNPAFVFTSSPDTNEVIETGDFDNSLGYGDVTNRRTKSELEAGNYNFEVTNLSIINKSGYTKVALRSTNDVDDIAPSPLDETSRKVQLNMGTLDSESILLSVTYNDSGDAPTVQTNDATNIYAYGATLNGEFSDVGNTTNYNLTTYFEYGETTDYELGETNHEGVLVIGGIMPVPLEFDFDLDGLDPDTTYHYRAVVLGSVEGYGEDKTFDTLGSDEPYCVTLSARSVGNSSAILVGKVLSDGGYDHNYVSFWLGQSNSVELYPANNQDLAEGQEFTLYLDGLDQNTTYYYNASIRVKDDGFFGASDFYEGNQVSFTTGAAVPSVVTYPIDSMKRSDTGAMVSGAITDAAGYDQFTISFDYGTDNETFTKNTFYGLLLTPTANTRGVRFSTGIGTFNIEIGKFNQIDDILVFEKLTANTKYYYRMRVDYFTGAFSSQTVYGNVESFTTLGAGQIITPTPGLGEGYTEVQTGTISNLAQGDNGQRINAVGILTNMGYQVTSVTCGFEIGYTNTYGHTVTAENKNSMGSYSTIIDGLMPNMTYHIRALAKGNVTATGADVVITTLDGDEPDDPFIIDGDVAPGVQTMSATGITSSQAQLNGDLLSLGSARDVEVGFWCGKTLSTLHYIASGTVTGGPTDFAVVVSGLTANTKYYFQAYAAGSGEAYGSTLNFTTNTSGGGGDDVPPGGDQPGLVHWLHTTLAGWGWDNQTGHWLLMAIMMIVGFGACVIMLRRSMKLALIAGVVVACLIFACFLVAGFLDWWVVVGLGLIIGIIAVIIFSRVVRG
jgi:hypothetical protein